MRIERIDGGFVQYFDNKFIEKIIWRGESVKVGTYTVLNAQNTPIEVDKYKFYGNGCVYFHDRLPREISSNNIDFCTAYNSQYGLPVSVDGSKLFVGSWEKGLNAYDIDSGSLLWQLKEGKIRQIFVYEKYLFAIKADAAVFKLAIDNGKLLGQVKSGTIENAYDLGFPYVLVDTLKGNLCVLNVENMKIVKNYGSKYGSKLTNPSSSLSLAITDVTLHGGTLTISGVEQENYSTTFSLSDQRPFSRVIDTNFNAL